MVGESSCQDPPDVRKFHEASLRDVPWEEVVAVPDRFKQRRCTVKETHRRAMTVSQFAELGNILEQILIATDITDPDPTFSVGRLTCENINLYHINDLLVLRLTIFEDGTSCAFMELLADGAQEPIWFVSHWWGTSFVKTTQMMLFHAKTRSLSDISPYWMCTFANDQHKLQELTEPDMLQTPFVRAINLSECMGTVIFLDSAATPFKRAWCILEAYVSLTVARREKGNSHLLDVASVIDEGSQVRDGRRIPSSVVILRDGGVDSPYQDVCEQEGARFPYDVSKCGAHIDIAKADASRATDKQNILRLVVRETDLNAAAPSNHPEYDKVNRALQEIFASRALFAHAMQGDTGEIQRLLDGGFCSADARTEDGTTAMHVAAQKGYLSVMHYLLEMRADPQPLNDNGASPALRAAQHDEVEALRILVEAGVDINVPNRKGNSPLSFAAMKDSENAAVFLANHGGNLNQANNAGDTPLTTAIKNGSVNTVKVLVESGAAREGAENALAKCKDQERAMRIGQLLQHSD